MRSVRNVAAAFAGFVVLLVAGAASAAPLPGLEVRRSATANDCPDAASLARGVEAKMKRPALDPSPTQEPAFTVQMDRGDKGYSAEVQSRGRLRFIEDDGATCVGLAKAIEITLALLLDEDSVEPAPPTPPAVTAPPPKKPAIWLFSPNELPPPDPVPPTPPRLQVVAHVVGTEGLTWPGSVGFDVRALAHFGKRWSLAASFLGLPSHAEKRLGGSVELTLLAGSLGPCVRAAGKRDGIGLDFCGSLDLGTLTGVGADFELNTRQVKLWGAADVDFSVGGPIAGPLLWSIRGGGVLPFVRETFLVQGGGTTPGFAAAPVGGLAGAGLGLTIW
jgi:hypothetical protein